MTPRLSLLFGRHSKPGHSPSRRLFDFGCHSSQSEESPHLPFPTDRSDAKHPPKFLTASSQPQAKLPTASSQPQSKLQIAFSKPEPHPQPEPQSHSQPELPTAFSHPQPEPQSHSQPKLPTASSQPQSSPQPYPESQPQPEPQPHPKNLLPHAPNPPSSRPKRSAAERSLFFHHPITSPAASLRLSTLPAPASLILSTLPTPDDLTPVLAEGDAIALPPTDETPDSGPDEPSTRVPHLGHALLFVAIAALFLILAQSVALLAGHPAHPLDLDPRLLIASEAIAYLLTLTAAFFAFPPLWQRPFLIGLQWNWPAATRNALRLLPLGLLLSAVVQGLSNYIEVPRELPIDAFFHSRSTVWLITVFGTVLAPMFEEVLFRGFLLPAFAIAYDWLCLPRTDAARATWQSSNTLTRNALIFSAVLTSTLFALVHGKQTAFTWPILALLFAVSLVLTTVRIRLRSVAASTLVHSAYNFTVFLTAFIATGGYQHLDRLPK